MADKITLAELEQMFGGSLPMEAYALIFEGDGSKTIKEVRAELTEMARQHVARTACHCGRDGHPLNSMNCPVHGYRTVSVETLRWWRQLVDINPGDLAPRIDRALSAGHDAGGKS